MGLADGGENHWLMEEKTINYSIKIITVVEVYSI